MPFIVFEDVLDNFGDDMELLKSTVSLSISLLPKYLAEVEKAIATEDTKALEVSAHTLKGSLSIYLFKPITQLAFELEVMGREGKLQEAPRVFAKLSAQFKPFLQELENFNKES